MHSFFTFSELSGPLAFAVHWLLQSTLLLGVGLVLGRLLQSRGSAAQSAVYRTTLVAVLLCPFATWSLSQAGLSGWSLVDLSLVNIEAPSKTTVAEFAEPITTPSLPTPKVEALQTSGIPLRGANSLNAISVATPPARQPTSRFAIAITVASMISMALLLRLALAWWRLARLRRQAVSADSETLALCRELAKTLKVPVPAVFCSPYVPSPCLAGIRRPAVLLPEENQQLSMRDVLIHELAHLRRHDCHWNLLRRATTSLFWFQPLFWKLSSRLEATAEEVCDDFVVQYGASRQEYAHRLVDIAELSLAPIAAAGVGMVSLRSMLAQRVARILDTSRKLSTQVNNRLLALVLAGGLVGTIVVGLVGVGSQTSQAETKPVASESQEPTANKSNPTEKLTLASSPKPSDASQQFAGKVIDPDGKPVKNAQLYLVFSIPQATGLLTPTWKPIATTDVAGEFRFQAGPKQFGNTATAREFGYGMLVAVKQGFGFAWSQAGKYETSGEWLEDVRRRMKDVPIERHGTFKRLLEGVGEPLKLTLDDEPIHGRVVDSNGKPVAKARLTLLRVRGKIGDDLTDWRKEAKAPEGDYYTARMKTPLSMNGPQVRSLVEPTVTDGDGRFSLRGVGRGRIVQLLLEGPGIASAKIYARTEAGEPIKLFRERRKPRLGSYIYYPSEITLEAKPSIAITGVVRDAETKTPLAGITVKSQSRHGEQISGWGQDFVRAVTDDQGRYRLEGMPIGSDNRIAAIAPTGDVPYSSKSQRAETSSQKDPPEIDFELRSSVWVEGRITDKQSGKGLSGRLQYFVKKGSPSYKFASSLRVDQRDRLLSDDEGRFRIAAFPGPGYVAFIAHEHQKYPRTKAIVKLDGSLQKETRSMIDTQPMTLMPNNYHLIAEVDPAEDAKSVELNLQLDSGKIVTGKVVDPDGKPITGFRFAGRMAWANTWSHATGSDTFELIGYDPASPRRVYFAHRKRNLAASTIVKDREPGNLTVKLQPAGGVKGRLVDEKGLPIANCPLVPWTRHGHSPADFVGLVRSAPLPPNQPLWASARYKTDAEGRFEISCLVPGIKYRLQAYDHESMMAAHDRKPRAFGPLEVVVQLKPGETKDLGDIRLADEEEFAAEAKQTASNSAVGETLVGVDTQTSLAETKSVVGESNQEAIAKRYECQLVDIISGRPIAGATVTVQRRISGDGKSFKQWPSVRDTKYTTDGKGRYTIDFRADEIDKPRLYVEISTRHPEYVNYYGGYSYSMIKKNLTMGSEPFFVSLDLWPAVKVTGTVVTPDGKPASGVHVSGYSKFIVGEVKGRGTFSNTKTNGKGIFQLQVVRGGKSVVWISPKEYCPSSHVFGNVPAELGKTALEFLKLDSELYTTTEKNVTTRDLGRIVLENGMKIQGRVVDVDGLPIEGVWVNADLRDGPAKKEIGMNVADRIVRSALTGADGRYHMGPLPPGIYRITPKDEPREQAIADRTPRPLPAEFFPQQVTLEESTPPESVDFRAVPRVTLVAQFYRSSGEPDSGGKVFIHGKHKEAFYSKRCRPDASGRIQVFAPLGLQVVTLDVITNEHSSIRHRLTKDGPLINETTIRLGTLTADMEEIAIIRYVAPILLVKAVDEEGKLIEEAWVTLMYAPGRAPDGGGQYIRNGRNAGHVSLEGNGDGRWRSSQLLPDEEFTLTVEAKGYESHSQKLSLPEGETREVVVLLKRA